VGIPGLFREALVRIRDAALGQGIVEAQSNPNYAPEKTVPAVVPRNDDYGRIERLFEDKDDVRLEFNIENKIFPEGKTSYNVVAEMFRDSSPVRQGRIVRRD
jgi:hypothetical protein